MKALIMNNSVIDICENQFEVHPSLIWVEAPEGCSTGWTYANGMLRAPDPLPEETYIEKRKREYPPIGDQLDALWKGGEAAAEMLSKVQAVKAKYPKPE
jgi:hypothetical protein